MENTEFSEFDTHLLLGAKRVVDEDGDTGFAVTYLGSESDEDISQLIADVMAMSPEFCGIIGNALATFNEYVDEARTQSIEDELGLTFSDEEEYED